MVSYSSGLEGPTLTWVGVSPGRCRWARRRSQAGTGQAGTGQPASPRAQAYLLWGEEALGWE